MEEIENLKSRLDVLEIKYAELANYMSRMDHRTSGLEIIGARF